MTEFRAPPPPPALDMDDVDQDQEIEEAPRSALDPKMIAVAVMLVVVGMIVGAIIFGGSSTPAQQTERNVRGLTNVVPNPSITEQLKMCGQTSESAPCILYIMNHSRYDRIAQDFFAEAAKLSQRNNYTVEIENAAYAKTKIPPSFFVQMKIPAIR